MPKYTILNTPVLHGADGKKTATRYDIGDEIELTEKEALSLGGNVAVVTPADKKSKGKAETAPADDTEKGAEK